MGVVKGVEWQAVDSSVFAFAAYRPEARQLYLRFKNGGIYRYFDCPAKVYEAFLAAESKGRYFSRCIRNSFRYEEVRLRRSSDSSRADQRRTAAHATGVYSPIR
jgi:hypothetical protein